MKAIIHRLTLKPKMLFLIDSCGALLTTFLLFFVLRNFNAYFGMPATTLQWLSAISAIFCVYSIACFWLVRKNWPSFIQIISAANLLYCALTTYLLIRHQVKLTILGTIYFLAEIGVICLLVYVELNVARRIGKAGKIS